MFKKLFFLMTALVLGIVFIADTASAVVLKINPAFSSVTQGDLVNVSIVISDFNADQSLGAFDLSLDFDNTILSLGNVSFGTQLSSWGLGSYQETTRGIGEVGLLEVSYESILNLNDHQDSSFPLAQLTFNTLGQWQQIPLVLSVNDLSDAAGYSISSFSTTNGNVTVTAPSVPVPAQVPLSSGHISVLLLVAGLGVVGAQRKFSIKV